MEQEYCDELVIVALGESPISKRQKEKQSKSKEKLGYGFRINQKAVKLKKNLNKLYKAV